MPIIVGYYAIKKGRKKYLKYKAEKQRKLAEERGELQPDDPSKELSTLQTQLMQAESTHAETTPAESMQTESTYSADSDGTSELDDETRRELENDPEFQEYMEQQRKKYLKQQRDKTLPPSYNIVTSQPASPAYNNVAELWSPVSALEPQSTQMQQFVQELPGSNPVQDYRSDIAKRPNLDTVVEADSTSAAIELPGSAPAVTHEVDRTKFQEIPA